MELLGYVSKKTFNEEVLDPVIRLIINHSVIKNFLTLWTWSFGSFLQSFESISRFPVKDSNQPLSEKNLEKIMARTIPALPIISRINS